MGSKKEEERNEKIIRGLMKLPPNRKCINCNSLGPQYVCTNFWSFVCITCSGIHREFTHRVKSVSMAKFTSQEVEALQNGGNQRAREIYLKDWDLQRQRLPDSSNVDKIRQFIKDVYTDKKYAGGKTSEKPPRDTQNRGIHDDETRRASSYHSYSQSPPYDYQYEDRKYGKPAASLTRRPGSDRGRYEGKLSSFVYSPNRLNEQMGDDRFSNDVSRVSDYSASSGGDPFRSGAQSPSFQKDVGFSSPPVLHSRGVSSEDVRHHRVDPFPQRSKSSGSFGSLDGSFISQNPFDLAADQQVGTQGSFDSLDFFEDQSGPTKVSSAAPIDLFQLPETPPEFSVNTFQSQNVYSEAHINAFQPAPASIIPLDLLSVADQSKPSNEKLPDFSAPINDGWATFDIPQSSAHATNNEQNNRGIIPSDGGVSFEKVNLFSSSDTIMQFPSYGDSSFGGPPIVPSVWNDNAQDAMAPNATNTDSWNAFEDSMGPQASGGIEIDSVFQMRTSDSSASNQFLHPTASSENLDLDSFNWGLPEQVSSSLVMGTEFIQPVLPTIGESDPASTDRKSNNPFDLPCDSELDEHDMFLDMNSLQSALPNPQLSSNFLGDVSEPWFPQNPASSYIPAPGSGGVAYLAPQAPTSQIPNVSSQGSVASIGGNPFA